MQGKTKLNKKKLQVIDIKTTTAHIDITKTQLKTCKLCFPRKVLETKCDGRQRPVGYN